MRNLSNEVISFAVAAVVVIASLFILDLGLIVSPVLGIAGFVVTTVVLHGRKPKELELKDTAEASVAAGREKYRTIKALGASIRNTTVSTKVDALLVTIDKMLKTVEEDPTKLKDAEQFLGYYLDTTITILKKFIDLASKNIQDSDIRNTLVNVVSMLDTLKDAMDKYLAKLVSTDAMNLDAELHLLKQTIDMEGLGKQATK